MKVYRITTAKWAGILSGSGYPARWNSKGVFVIYTTSTRALACLENLVHRSGEGLNGLFKITEIEIPNSIPITTITDKELPANWYRVENSEICREIGDRWIQEGKTLLRFVPSAIIRDEHNILINPNHPDFEQVKITEITEFEFDKRL